MTKVGRFTVWVIVAVIAMIAMIVVYFMAYAGIEQASPATR